MGSYIGIELHPCFYIIRMFLMYLLIRIHPSISLVTKHYLKLPSSKTDAFYCLYMSTIPVQCTCSVANQVQACDMHHACITCVHWQSWADVNCIQQCMCTPILHAVNVQTHEFTGTHV